MLRLISELMQLQPKYPFVIARGQRREHNTLLVRLVDEDGLEGWGEAAPSPYYGESIATVEAVLPRYAAQLGNDPFALEVVERNLERVIGHNPSARAAVSMALHDLVGKRLGIPLWKYWGLDPTRTPVSSYTIGIDRPELIEEKTRQADAAGYPVLKVKLGGEDDEEILKRVVEHFDGEIRVDANAAWSAREAVARLPMLRAYDVTLLEQPVAAADHEGLLQVRRAAEIPVIADESCLTALDIPVLAGRVDGINLKLAKCGSLREAIRMIGTARAHHLQVMVGCMLESSLGITALAHLSPLVDYADLDGAALLVNDPFIGASIPQGRITLPSGPGLGVVRR